jgi:hypothetical protein
MNRRIKQIVAGVLTLTLWVHIAYGAAPALEYQVKASYLYNFVRFITWPEDTFAKDGKFNLCVVGAERFGGALDEFAGERVEGHTIVVRRLESAAQARAARCHMLFLAAGVAPDESASLSAERGLLTVGETPGFLARGGIINLVEVRGRIRFEINQAVAQQAGLVISSRLLSLSKSP